MRPIAPVRYRHRERRLRTALRNLLEYIRPSLMDNVDDTSLTTQITYYGETATVCTLPLDGLRRGCPGTRCPNRLERHT